MLKVYSCNSFKLIIRQILANRCANKNGGEEIYWTNAVISSSFSGMVGNVNFFADQSIVNLFKFPVKNLTSREIKCFGHTTSISRVVLTPRRGLVMAFPRDTINLVKTPPSLSRHDLVTWLDEYLNIKKISDVSVNGLQLEGKEQISRIAVAVDSTLATIEEALEAGADLLIVHHGWFWKDVQPITGPLAKRVKAAIAGNLNLYAAHLPLDLHPEVGNNAVMAKALSLHNLEPFGFDRGVAIGLKGTLPVPQSLQDFSDGIQKLTGEVCLVHGGGTPMVSSVAILSGGGAGFVAQAAAAGVDTYLTGEPEHSHFSDAFEYGINTIFAGHYESETFGVRALAVKLEDTFGLPWQFLHLPTGL